MYQEILNAKRENLVAELRVELNQKAGLMMVDRLNDWYQVKAFQFRSINSVDRMQLEQAGSEEFVQDFLRTLDAFSFSAPDEASFRKVPPMWQGALLGAAAAVISFLVLKPFTPLAFTVILSAAAFFAALAVFHTHVRKKAAESNQTVKKEYYVSQLSDHLKKLSVVCDKYGVK